MIKLDKLTKRYGSTLAVNGVSIDIARGETCILIGPSGCGKTTVLRMINRLIEPTSGHVFIADRDNADMRPEELRRSMGYVIQSIGLFPHITVADNIAVVPELLHWSRDRIVQRVRELMILVGLEPDIYAGKYPGKLSGGEAQRVGVARALAADPPIMLMDEPFGAVDPLTREKLQTQFMQIQSALHKTVIMVTHDLDEAIRLADRIAVMHAGQIVQYDTPENILSRPSSKFVHDFVGTDRALKRLSRLAVTDFLQQAPVVAWNDPLSAIEKVCRSCAWVWVVDSDRKLLGWIDAASVPLAADLNQAMVKASLGEIALSRHATLREALSRMLGQGMKNIPVVDNDGHVMGEITLGAIEQVTAGMT